MFDKFESRVVMRTELVSQAPLRIAAGKDREIGGPEFPVVKDAANRPFIPGTTLRGSMRAFAEALVRGSAGSAGVCEHGNCHPDKNVCLVCSVFGSRHLASHVSFDDCKAVAWYGQLELRLGMPVNRDTGRGDTSSPWEQEAVSAATRFAVRAELNNGAPWMRGMVAVCLNALADGMIAVGAGKSRGMGAVRAEQITYSIIDSPHALISRLDQGRLDDGDSVSEEDRLAWIGAFKQKLAEVSNVQTAGE